MHNKKISTLEASLLLIGMLVILALGIIHLQLMPQVPVLLIIALFTLWATIRKIPLNTVTDSMASGIQKGIIPLLIFILVGALIGVWLQAGIIQSLMVFGFSIVSVQWFLPTVFLVTAIVGTAIGSAFTVISTLGLVFIGIGTALGLNPAMVAGAIISGAIFGDKTSPLSDSTNLAAAISGGELFAHIKNLSWSTIPAFFVSLIIYTIIGHTQSHVSLHSVATLIHVLEAHASVSAWAILPIGLLLIGAWLKIPAIPTLLLNISVTAIMILFQGHVGLKTIANVIETGFISNTGNHQVDALLTRGGITSMLGTVGLIILTLSLGGILLNLGIIETVMVPITKRLKSNGTLVLGTILTGISMNLLVGEQYLSVILPGNAFKEEFDKRGLAPVALGRVLEDGGTVINYLIPWGVAGAFAATTLGVPVLTFLPFVFFSWLSPIFSLFSGFTGIGLKKIDTVNN
ncbi:Na+/H+ antiporter NhaC [Periweissella cryptocerci]|uniref:Na+/H+ antiporter NhaC n=1 Tax=Periweissella cryptocerci TaxID=2506420 RepID=A0A4V1AIS1_9LACO|nr:Na+/H+ antiporter NhaC [Periweissella cryptocerci]QBO36485.1 Na+/H+ antiporter NhaC [Periweissella cryptocerci]